MSQKTGDIQEATPSDTTTTQDLLETPVQEEAKTAEQTNSTEEQTPSDTTQQDVPTQDINDIEDEISSDHINVDSIDLPNVEDVIDEQATDIDTITLPDSEETVQNEPAPTQAEEPIDLSLLADATPDDT